MYLLLAIISLASFIVNISQLSQIQVDLFPCNKSFSLLMEEDVDVNDDPLKNDKKVWKVGSSKNYNNANFDNGPLPLYPFPKNITSFHQLQRVNMNVAIPQNLNIVMVGDSVTRYQYLSLVYFLKFGRWINPNSNSAKMVIKKSTHTMFEWYNFSKSMLSPFEQCDCFSDDAADYKSMGVNDIENRYFREPTRNNSVTYLQKLGHKTNWKTPLHFKSQWNLSDINSIGIGKPLHHDHNLVTGVFGRDVNYIHETGNWTQFIKDFVSNLQPKPNVFIFNQGLWNHDDFTKTSIQKEIVGAISDAGMISIYKTTTKWQDAGPVGGNVMDEYEQQFCNLTDYCLDLSWTGVVPESLYIDRAHFYEPVYAWFNINLLNTLSSFIS